jgi:hypothetical protein
MRRFKLMKSILGFGLCGVLLAACNAESTAQQMPKELAGNYALQGVRETAGELKLSPDGRFDFALSYGAVDQEAHGKWSVSNGKVKLVADPSPAASFAFIAAQPTLSDDYAKFPDKPVLLVVKVSTPRLAMTWSNMEVAAEFSNGQQRSGTTGNDGRLAFVDRQDAEWRGAVIRRVSVAYPKANAGPTWFKVESSKIRTLEINFEPGPLVPRFFEHAELSIEGDKVASALVFELIDGRKTDGPANKRFVRR